MDKNIEEIMFEGKLMAMVLYSNYDPKNTCFFSPKEYSQQLGFLVFNKGHSIKAHFHKEIRREIMLTQEVLFVKRGKILVNLYSTGKKHLTSRELNSGDVIFLCFGGHGIKILEDTQLIEVKQGPYSGRDSDKETFEGVENDTGK